jgi:hypothetical protein
LDSAMFEDDSAKISNMANASIGRDTHTSKNLSHAHRVFSSYATRYTES